MIKIIVIMIDFYNIFVVYLDTWCLNMAFLKSSDDGGYVQGSGEAPQRK